MDTDIYAALRPVIEFLERKNIRHCVGGSLASSSWSAPRSTNDADVVADLDVSHAQPLADFLGEDFYVSVPSIRDAVTRRSSFNLIHYPTSLKVDIFVLKDREFDQQAMSRCVRRWFGPEGDGLEVWITAPEDIVLNKLVWYEKGNRISERQLLDIRNVLTVQQHNLDIDYLMKWATVLRVAELLEQALQDTGLA